MTLATKKGARTVATVPSTIQKNITIRELETTSLGSVYVINRAPRGQRGDILFSAPKMHGTGVDAVRVIKTWIPQDLTEQVTKQQLLNSSEFRRTVSKGLIELVSVEYADKVMSQSDAQVELQRIQNSKAASAAVLKAAHMTTDDERTPTQKRRDENRDRVLEEASSPDSGDGAQFEIFLQSLGAKTEVEIVNALRNEGELSTQELKAVMVTFSDRPKVVRFCERQLEG